jgi:hypothetical protein
MGIRFFVFASPCVPRKPKDLATNEIRGRGRTSYDVDDGGVQEVIDGISNLVEFLSF